MKDKVYALVAKIPKGKVSTYGKIAKQAGLKSARTVGMYIHTNKDPEKVPCHRVVFSNGSLSKGYGMGGIKKQKVRLLSEGVRINGYVVDKEDIL